MIESYINEMGNSLEKFKETGGKYNFRCNICGDSNKSSFKARGWFIKKNSEWFFHCFNCGETLHISKYMKLYFPELYRKYIFDIVSKNRDDRNVFYKKPKKSVNTEFLKKVLIPVHKSNNVCKYLDSRKIPKDKQSKFYIIKDFSVIRKLEKYKDSKLKKEPRLVLPIFDKNGDISGLISRALVKGSIRYINLNFNEEENIFGIYNDKGEYEIDLNEPIKVVEGSIDSLFIDNCVSVNCADLTRVRNGFGFLSDSLDFIFIPDNENRNKEIVSVYENIIDNNDKIVFIPDDIEGKDINEYVLKNESINIDDMINNNIYQGLMAKLKLSTWRKV